MQRAAQSVSLSSSSSRVPASFLCYMLMLFLQPRGGEMKNDAKGERLLMHEGGSEVYPREEPP